MLNIFPELFTFSIWAVTLIRITAGFLFLRFGWLKLGKDKKSKLIFFEKIGLRPAVFWLWVVALSEIIVGTMIVAGFLTQPASILASFIMLVSIIIKIRKPNSLPNTLDFYILFFVIFVSLIFLGAGAFAFDLPL